jgi:hypothetical protein
MIKSKYDILRGRAQTSANAQQQGESDALKRRYTALGMGGSGAAIKSEMQSQESARDRLSQTNENIGFQEAAETERKDEADTMRKFATSEREGSQLFARGEREGSQLFASGESALSRRFAADQAAQAMKFQTSERLGSEKFSSAENKENRRQAKNQFDAQMRAQKKQFESSLSLEQKKFFEEIRVNDFNMKMAAKMAGQKGLIDRFLGGINQFGGNASDVFKGYTMPGVHGGSDDEPWTPW